MDHLTKSTEIMCHNLLCMGDFMTTQRTFRFII